MWTMADRERLVFSLYIVLTALHFVSLAVTGILWTYVDLVHTSPLKRHFRDIRAVHFGSLYLIPMFLGLAWAFERLQVPPLHQAVFPVGLGLLILFSSIGYLFPLPEKIDPFYYWTRGWPLVLALIGLVCLVTALLWTAAVLAISTLLSPIAGVNSGSSKCGMNAESFTMIRAGLGCHGRASTCRVRHGLATASVAPGGNASPIDGARSGAAGCVGSDQRPRS